MSTLTILFQLAIALTIINVWVFRVGKPTPFRPDGASNMEEEFARYGFPDWLRSASGFAKLSLAALLIAGIWYPPAALVAAAGMALLMLGAVVAHVKIGDPVKKTLPALSLLLLCVFVVAAHGAEWL